MVSPIPGGDPYELAADVVSGSAREVSFLLRRPPRAAGERLLLQNGMSAKFWSVNICWDAPSSSANEADDPARRLAAPGCNLVRIAY